MTVTLYLATISAIASFFLTLLVRRYMLHHQILDVPNHRSSHSAPVPRGGGIAVLAAAALSIGIGAAKSYIDRSLVITLGAGVLALAVIGLWDDRAALNPRLRLGVHFLVAFFTIAFLRGMPSLDLGTASLAFGALGYVLGVLGIVWSINLFNFMDGLDGLATSQAMLYFGAVSVLIAGGERSVAAICAILAAACAGFLYWNWPPAKIFLGDVGSGPIGYLMASLAIASENRGALPLLVFAIIAGVLIVDATATLARRSRRGLRLSEAHRDHAYQRLSRAWGSHGRVTIAAGILTIALALLGTIGSAEPRLLVPVFLISYAGLLLLFLAIERRAPFHQTGTIASDAKHSTESAIANSERTS